MNSFRWFMRRRFFTVVVLLALAVLFRGAPLAAQSNTNYNDDGYFYVYTSMYISGTSISAYASDPQPDFFETWGSYEVLGDPFWSLDGGNYSDSGDGYSFSTGPVPLGNTYYASFYFYVEYFGQAAYSGEGPLECVPGQLGDGDTCNGYDYPVGYVSLDVPYPPPVISSVSPGSAYQGQQGTLTVSGSNFVNYSSEPLVLHWSGGGNPFTQTGLSSTCTTGCSASFSFNFTGYSPGTYNVWISNDESTSEPMKFTIYSGNGSGGPAAPPVDPCAVTSSPQVGYTSVVPTSTPGSSGSLAISFSGTAYAAVSANIAYGPYSTSESIASAIAATITRNYYSQYA